MAQFRKMNDSCMDIAMMRMPMCGYAIFAHCFPRPCKGRSCYDFFRPTYCSDHSSGKQRLPAVIFLWRIFRKVNVFSCGWYVHWPGVPGLLALTYLNQNKHIKGD